MYPRTGLPPSEVRVQVTVIDYFEADTLTGLVKTEGTEASTNVYHTNHPGPQSKESAHTLY